MDKGNNLTLNEVGELIFNTTQAYLFREKTDLGIEVFMQKGSLQEMMTLLMQDGSRLLVKTFPHINYSNDLVFRIEVYKTKEGDLRGNRVAFLEANSKSTTGREVRSFVESFLSQVGL